MNSIRVSLTVLAFLISFSASAKEVTDTLRSDKNDRIIITYSVHQKDDQVDLQFIRARKILGDYHREKYKKDDKIHTLFFDWVGVRKDMEFSSDLIPSAITFSTNTEYTFSDDGYFIIEHEPRPHFSFKLKTAGEASVSIPIYLAYYEKKQHYKILCYCGDLKVNVKSAETLSEVPQPESKPEYQPTENTVIEIEDDFSDIDDEALNLINFINNSLPNQKELPIESTLEEQVKILIGLQPKTKSDEVSERIRQTLEAYENKKKELAKNKAIMDEQKADDNAFANCSTKEQYESYIRQYPNGRHVDDATDKITDFENKDQEETKNKNKRTIWMIIGGALLAILLFVGNQVLQSFRNIRTQRSIMQMQQDATKRAENMAKGKARSEIRKQTNKVVNQAKQKGQTAIRNTANNATKTKGNKRVSI